MPGVAYIYELPAIDILNNRAIMRIYIDHFPEQDELAKTLASRIKKQNSDVNVTTYFEQRAISKNVGIEHSKLIEDTERKVINLVNESDIIIPLISSSYVEINSSSLNALFNDTSERKDKFIFPVICNESNWSSVNWIVRSKVFPQGGRPLDELTVYEQEKSIKELLQTIQNIAYNKPQQDSELKVVHRTEKIVFISHDHEDADFAELLKLQLEKSKITGWIDSERLKIGQDWREEIDEGISKSIAVIAIMTPEAKKSEYVTYEWAYAWGKGKNIFPIMLKQTPLHPRLESLQYLDFTNRATRPWDKLIQSIKDLL
ncbi:MAG: toll/interleukin-1 receptor domain-containing protein [Chitinophagaceae bacterium]|nr:toll/interleukin-1 receptor domain-containing protein [Chitinophagaceae bacterium]